MSHFMLYGNKCVLSISLESRANGSGWTSSMLVGEAYTIESLAEQLIELESQYIDDIRNGSNLIVEVQDYPSDEDLRGEDDHW